MSRDAKSLLTDVEECAEAIKESTAGLEFDTYLANREKQDSVERRLMIIGEALNQLDSVAPDLAKKIPDLRKAIGLRNRLTHVYHQIDHAAIWDTAVKDIPQLSRIIGTLLSELSSPRPSEEHKSNP